MSEIDNLLEERRKDYGNAWYLAGTLIQKTAVLDSKLFRETPFSHNFVLILSKLCRALKSPFKRDNYIDAIGYLTLIVQFLDENNLAE